MPLKQQKKTEQKKDAKTEFELKIQSYINSQYSMIIPVKDDTVIFIKDPVTIWDAILAVFLLVFIFKCKGNVVSMLRSTP